MRFTSAPNVPFFEDVPVTPAVKTGAVLHVITESARTSIDAVVLKLAQHIRQMLGYVLGRTPRNSLQRMHRFLTLLPIVRRFVPPGVENDWDADGELLRDYIRRRSL